MPASEARILANRKNAEKSTGPKTPEGKDASRRNALKHGLTGAGVVLPESDAAEVERSLDVFATELDAQGELELIILRDAALCSVRMERLADQQNAMLTERVILAQAEFEAPDDATPEEIVKLRNLVTRQAMFDPSKEATLARQYEAAARRGFYKALKELRELRKEKRAVEQAAETPITDIPLGSFAKWTEADKEFDAWYEKLNIPLPPERRNRPEYPPVGAEIDFAVGVQRKK